MADVSQRRIWALLGSKAGDNAQISHLASLAGGEVETMQLRFNRTHVMPNLLLGASVATVASVSRASLRPPWPDAVIAAGKRSVPAALWVKQQSGGKSRIVHIGRPRAPLNQFDLVITTPQYGLPDAANLLELPVPLVPARRVPAFELAQWEEAWAKLPRPLVAVAIGGAKFPLQLGEAEFAQLASRLDEMLERSGGSAVIMASPRTPAEAVYKIASGLRSPHLAYGRFERTANPYGAGLKLCDRLVVTSDSASMISDGLRAGKPVDVFRLPVSPWRVSWSGRRGLGAALSRSGLLQPPRAMAHLVEQLIANGLVGELGGNAARGVLPDLDQLVAGRIEQLFSGR